MEDTRVLDLKKAAFYYLMSWRVTILCLVLCVALLLGYTYLKPSSQQLNSLPDDPKQEEELLAKRDKFIADNAEAKDWSAQITGLEKEVTELNTQLNNNLFLQIDPNRRINKSFSLRFSYFMVDFKDEEEEARTNQMLSLHYMRQLASDRYLNYLATKGILKFSPENLANLIEVRIGEDGFIVFKISGSEEIIIDQLIKSTQEFLENYVRPDIDLLATHYLRFSNVNKEVVRDPSITLLKKKIESEIALKEGKIEELNKSIDDAFITFLEEEGEITPDGSQAPKPYKRNIVLGLFLGLVLSVVLTVIRYRQQMTSIDVAGIAEANRIPYLCGVPCLSENSVTRKKRFGRSVDNFFIRMFGMAYDDNKATIQINYVAQVLQGILKTKLEKEDSSLEYRSNEEVTASVNILVPDVRGDICAKDLLERIQQTLDKDKSEHCKRITLVAGSSLTDDPDTVLASRDSMGLLLLYKNATRSSNLLNGIRRSVDLSKEIVGVLELEERF